MTQQTPTPAPLLALGIGWGTRSAANTLLDVWFPAPLRLTSQEAETLTPLLDGLLKGETTATCEPAALTALIAALPDAVKAPTAPLLETALPLELVWLPTDEAITDTATAYLKLHLLSHCLCLPNSLNLEGIFAHLPTVAWTNEGPVAPDELTSRQRLARAAGRVLDVQAIDKFPKLTNYLAPPGVRIADSARVRLGAYLGSGSTVMHEGFVNFNAGAVGPNMIEGRISQGVIIGADTDLGGSSSTMGTLSGGGAIRISIGEQCLIGANAGTGIPLGDRCTIEAGLYLTAATPVTLIEASGERLVKARELAGLNDLLFLRNGRSGRVECRSNGRAITLNDALHAHN